MVYIRHEAKKSGAQGVKDVPLKSRSWIPSSAHIEVVFDVWYTLGMYLNRQQFDDGWCLDITQNCDLKKCFVFLFSDTFCPTVKCLWLAGQPCLVLIPHRNCTQNQCQITNLPQNCRQHKSCNGCSSRHLLRWSPMSTKMHGCSMFELWSIFLSGHFEMGHDDWIRYK